MPIVTITCFVQSCQQKTLMRCASKIERIRIHCQVRECWLRAVNQKAITHNWDKLRWRGNGRAWRPTCRALRAGPARGRDSKWILRTRSVRRRRRTPTSTVTRAVCPAGNRWNCTSAPNCWPPCDPAGTDPGTWRVLAAAATNRGPMWVRVRGVTWRAVSPRYRHRKGPLTTSSSNPWSCWLGNFSYTILPTPKLHDVWAAGRTHTHTHTRMQKRDRLGDFFQFRVVSRIDDKRKVDPSFSLDPSLPPPWFLYQRSKSKKKQQTRSKKVGINRFGCVGDFFLIKRLTWKLRKSCSSSTLFRCFVRMVASTLIVSVCFFCVQNEMMESFLICLPPSLSPFLPCRTGLKWADPTERQLGRGGRDRFDRRLARNAIIAGWARFDYCFFFGLFFFHSRTRARYRAHDGILWDGRPEENDPMKAEFGVGQWTEAKFSSFFLAPAMEKKEGNRKNIRTQPNALTYAGTQH